MVSYVTMSGSTGHSLDGILNPSNIKQLFNYDVLLQPDKWGLLIGWPVLIHLIIYTAVFLLLCIVFGKFWVETTGLSAENVADQIQKGGMQIPGFRRDKRVVERVLNRYIPQITIISSIAVGLLAVGADLLGALGSGTGILLTVGILYRLYEELEKESADIQHEPASHEPVLSK